MAVHINQSRKINVSGSIKWVQARAAAAIDLDQWEFGLYASSVGPDALLEVPVLPATALLTREGPLAEGGPRSTCSKRPQI